MDPLGPIDPFDSPQARLSDRLDDLIVWVERQRAETPRIVVVLVVATVLGAGGWWRLQAAAETPVENEIPLVTLNPVDAAVAQPEVSALPGLVTVHVAGAVASPGVFVLDDGARVIDAVDAAGGALAGADLSLVNLASPLVDGTQIRIPLVGETVVAPLVPLGATSSGSDDGPVNLNSASESDLETLPGVGPATAAAIVTWRTNNGPFTTPEQLLDVPGIGPAKFAALAERVVVG